jgi:hypothetical protein
MTSLHIMSIITTKFHEILFQHSLHSFMPLHHVKSHYNLHSFMPLHHVKSHYNLILYYTSTYIERVGVSQHDNACSFIFFLDCAPSNL